MKVFVVMAKIAGIESTAKIRSVIQESAEDVDDPLEAINQGSTNENHRQAHYQCAQDAPEKYPVLVFRRHLKIGEDEEKDEKIIYGEREFNEVSSKELKAACGSLISEHKAGKDHRQRNPDCTPRRGFSISDSVGFSI